MLAGVRIMNVGDDTPTAELRLEGGKVIAVSGGDRAGIVGMLNNGIHLWDGDLVVMAEVAELHDIDLPTVGKEGIQVDPDQGEMFLLAVLSRYARSSGYSRAEAVEGEDVAPEV